MLKMMHSVRTPGYRPDIDGLRAIAVLAVVAYHYAPLTFRGGFIGVDIFFTISGFLITHIIVGHLSQGNFSFAEFYARRARRILPALLLVLSATLAFSAAWLFPLDLQQAGKHVAAGAGFVSNWVLWNERGYFDTSAQSKPLLHLWSLAIEEQFYFAWPLILWAAWKMTRGLLPLVALLSTASFVMGLELTQAGSVGAFYSPASRAWELLLGGALSLVSLNPAVPAPAAPAPRSNTRSLFGLGLILAGFALIDAARQFPGWWALLPAIGTVAVISAGQRAWLNSHVLGSRPLVRIGVLSYPLYLWHWPLLVCSRLAGDINPSRGTRAALLLASLALAWVTNRLVEQPVRLSRRPSHLTAALVGGVAAVGTAGALCWLGAGFPDRFPQGIRQVVSTAPSTAEWREGSCFLRADQDADGFAACPVSRSSGKPVLLLWGDSDAAQLASAYRRWFYKYDTLQRTASACRPILGVHFVNQPRCHDINDAIWRSLPRMKPARVVLAGRWATIDWTLLRSTLSALKSQGIDQVDLIGPAPEWQSPLPRLLYARYEASEPHIIPKRLGEGLVPGLPALDAAMRSFAQDAGIHYISLLALLCDSHDCLATIDGKPTAWDGFHLSPEAAMTAVAQFPGADASGIPPAPPHLPD